MKNEVKVKHPKFEDDIMYEYLHESGDQLEYPTLLKELAKVIDKYFKGDENLDDIYDAEKYFHKKFQGWITECALLYFPPNLEKDAK